MRRLATTPAPRRGADPELKGYHRGRDDEREQLQRRARLCVVLQADLRARSILAEGFASLFHASMDADY